MYKSIICIICTCIFTFIKFNNYSINKKENNINSKNTPGIINNNSLKEGYDTNKIENSESYNKLRIRKANKFIFFKPFSRKRLYFSISNEILLSKNILGFNGYIANLIHEFTKNGVLNLFINQTIFLLFFFLSTISCGIIPFFDINVGNNRESNLKYFCDLLRICFPNYYFYICKNNDTSFFYKLNCDFGFRKILINSKINSNSNNSNILIKIGNYTSTDKCSICLSPFNNQQVLIHTQPTNLNNCQNTTQHVFHDKCILEWYTKQKHECPICRNKIFIQPNDIPNSHKINNFESYFYFDISPEINVEHYILNKIQVTPFGRLGIGAGIHGILTQTCDVLIFPKIFINTELGINFYDKYELVLIIKPTYLFRTRDNDNNYILYEKAFMFDIILSFNIFFNKQKETNDEL